MINKSLFDDDMHISGCTGWPSQILHSVASTTHGAGWPIPTTGPRCPCFATVYLNLSVTAQSAYSIDISVLLLLSLLLTPKYGFEETRDLYFLPYIIFLCFLYLFPCASTLNLCNNTNTLYNDGLFRCFCIIIY
jgi:hypothetical protein